MFIYEVFICVKFFLKIIYLHYIHVSLLEDGNNFLYVIYLRY